MRAKLKRLHSPDVDLPNFVPEDPASFGFLLQIMVGPESSEGEESFDVTVCTAEWLRSKYADRPVVSLRHHLLLTQYDYQCLQSELSRLVARCVGDTWLDVVKQVSQIGRWEFDAYRSEQP